MRINYAFRKIVKAVLLFSTAILLVSCASTIQFDQSTQFADEDLKIIKLGNNHLVRIPTSGEVIYVNAIVEQENIKEGHPIILTKVNGQYFLIGSFFQNLWSITPHIKNKGKLKKIAIPDEAVGQALSFEHKAGSDGAFILLLKGKFQSGNEMSLILENSKKLVNHEN